MKKLERIRRTALRLFPPPEGADQGEVRWESSESSIFRARIGKSVPELPFIPRFFAAHFFLWAAAWGIAMALLALVDTAWAATIEQFSLRHTGHAVEVEFAVQGTTPRWHLHTHGQELRLDLDHSRVAAFAEPVSWPVFFPLAQVSMR
ncbi:MAG: hypothetical protein JO189_33560, partial [Deltaproteobacteria bacterium]|nr:hypothetical protein [Deltaproteobacteria bacterium]